MASDHADDTTPGRRRRSWFDPRQSLAFDVDKPSYILPASPEEGDMEELVLTHFTKSPRIDFGTVIVGKQKTRYIRVRNPNEFEQHVVVEKFPHKKHFVISQTDFTVNPMENVILTIVWSPSEACNSREMVLLKVDRVYRLQAYLFGKSEVPKTKKGRKGIRKMVSAKPLSDGQHKENLPKGQVSLNEKQVAYSSHDLQSHIHSSAENKENQMHGNKHFIKDPLQVNNATQGFGTKGRQPFSKAALNIHNPLPKESTCNKGQDTLNATDIDIPEFPSLNEHMPEYGAQPLQKAAHVDVLRSAVTHEGNPLRTRPFTDSDRVNLSEWAIPDFPASEVMQRTQGNQDENNLHMDIMSDPKRETFVKKSEETHFLPTACPDTPTRRETYVKSAAPCGTGPVANHPIGLSAEAISPAPQRKTFEKDDPALPCTPMRRTTFMKERPALPNTPLIELNSPHSNESKISPNKFYSDVFANLDGTPVHSLLHSHSHRRALHISTPPIPEEAPFDDNNLHLEDLAVSGQMKRFSALPKKKDLSLRDVSQSPQMLEERLKVLKETPEVFCKTNKHDKGDAALQSQYSTAFTTPYESPEEGSSDDDVFEDSLMVQTSCQQKAKCIDIISESSDKTLPTTESGRERVSERVGSEGIVAPCEIVIRVSAEVSRRSRGSWQPSPVIHLAQQAHSPSDSHLSSPTSPNSYTNHASQSSLDQIAPTTSTVASLANHVIPASTSNTPVKGNATFDKDEPEIAQHVMSSESTSHSNIVENIFDERIVLQPKVHMEQDHRLSSTPAYKSTGEINLFSSSKAVPSPIVVNQQTVTKHQSPPVPCPPEQCQSRKNLFSDESIGDGQIVAGPNSDSCRRFSTLTVTKTKPVSDVLQDANSREKFCQLFPNTDASYQPMAVPLPQEVVPEDFPVNVLKPSPPRKRPSLEKQNQPVQTSKKIKREAPKPTLKPATKEPAKWLTARKGLVVAPKRSPCKAPEKRRSGGLAPQRRPAAGPVNRSSLQKSPNNRVKSRPAAVKGLAKPKLLLLKQTTKSALPKHPMPFASKNMFYDERWMEKEERGFTAWLNFVLTPPDEYFEARKPQKINAGALCMEMCKDNVHNPKLAPTKEVLSFRAYSARNRLNRLRRSACKLFQSEQFVRMTEKLEREIDCGRMAVRKDRKLHTDLGIKQRVLELLLSYNPLWLRIGLETIYGEVISMQTNADVVGLSRFVVTRLLGNPDIAAEYSHPTVPHLYRDGYDEALGAFILKKFLLLVGFLDFAKSSRLVQHDPCLFCKDADVKSSRDLLILFARDYLRGEGDITRHLGYMGCNVKHQQTPLNEFDFAVAKVASDLRDGIRLTRVVEMLTGEWSWSSGLRVPAISRLQKIHNVGLAFKALAKNEIQAIDNKGVKVAERDIVDGHREKTLALLWNIIFNFQVKMMISQEQLEEEICFLKQNLHLRTCMEALVKDTLTQQPTGTRRESGLELYLTNPRLALLLTWCKTVCDYYSVKVENFTVSFSDGRVLCYLVHHYHPSLLPNQSILDETTLTCQGNAYDISATDSMDDSNADSSLPYGKPVAVDIDYEKLKANEKENFRVLRDAVSELGSVPFMLRASDMSSTIPDEKVVITFVTYLCARLLDLRHETRAARKIQNCWRKYRLHKQLYINKNKLDAVAFLQRSWRRCLARRRAVRERTQRRAAMSLQAVVRGFLARRRWAQQQRSAVVLQSCWRGFVQRRYFTSLCSAASLVQARYKANKVARQHREDFLNMKSRVTRIQAICRGWLVRQTLMRTRASIVIQAAVRGYLQRMENGRRHNASVVIQAHWRGTRAVKQYSKLYQACVTLQRRHRANQVAKTCARKYDQLRGMVVLVQSLYRGIAARKHVARIRAARTIQAWFRSRQVQLCYCKLRRASVLVQSQWRMVQERKRFIAMRCAAITLQQRLRAVWLARQQQMHFKKLQHSACHIQATLRMYNQRKAFTKQRQAAITIQAWYKGVLQRHVYESQRAAATIVQQHWRAHLLCREQRARYLRYVGAVVLAQCLWRRRQAVEMAKRHRAARSIQASFRMHVHRSIYVEKKTSAIKIQSWFRMVTNLRAFTALKTAAMTVQAKYRLKLEAQKQRNAFLSQRAAILCLQSAYRGKMARQLALKMRAARTIQSAYRMSVKRHNYIKKRKAAVTIQSWYRMTVKKRQYLVLKQATVTLQKHIRATLEAERERRKYLKFKGAVICAQSLFRGLLARQRVNQIRAAVKIQSAYRMLRSRKIFTKQKLAATKIQAAFRMYCCRTRYASLRSATLCLQQQYRAYIAGREARGKFLERKKQAVIIQSVYRGYQDRKLAKRHRAARCIQSVWKMWKAEKEYCTVYAATVCIQTYLRRHFAQKQFRLLKNAATTVQSHWRAKMSGRLQFVNYQRKRNSAIQLQSVYRGFVARKLLQKMKAACVIQSAYRRFYQRRKYQAKLLAAVTIQRGYRSWRLALDQRFMFHAQRGAAIVIQSAFRAWKARLLARRIRAAIIIQKQLRCYLAKQAYHDTRKKVIIVQALVRSHLAKCHYNMVRQATVCIQQHWRATLCMGKHRANFLTLKQSAVTIQCHYRAHLARIDYLKIKTGIVRLQALVKTMAQRRVYMHIRESAVKIQCWIRAVNIGVQCRQQYHEQKQAAIIIQAAYRGRSARNRYCQLRQAATAMQALVRGKRQCEDYQALRSAALVIQIRWRATLSARTQRELYTSQKKSVTLLQAHYRGRMAQRSFQIQRRAAVLIQASVRSKMQRRKYQTLQKAVCVLQNRTRAYLAGKRVRSELTNKTQAAKVIQSFTRQWLTRKLATRESSALSIQKYYRAYVARKNYTNLLEQVKKVQSCIRKWLAVKNFKALVRKQVAGAVTIQRWFRAMRLGQQCFKQFNQKKHASVVLQAAYRGRSARNRYCRLRQAATAMQALVRGKRQREDYQALRSAALVIQIRWRATLSARTQRELYTSQKKSVTLLQAHYRRRMAQRSFQIQRRAAVLIQASVRSKMQRRKYQTLQKAVCVLQNRTRAYLAGKQVRSELTRKTQAAKVIQSFTRQWLTRKLATRESSALSIQRYYRGYVARKNFKNVVVQVKKVQSCIRRWLASRRCANTTKKNQAARAIQNCYRLYKERLLKKLQRGERLKYVAVFAERARWQLAAMHIQRWYRRHQVMIRARTHLTSIVFIQRCIRARLQRLYYLRLRASVCILQRAAKTYIQRRNCAAMVIQRAARCWLVKRQEGRCRWAASVLQACWRGRAVRKQLRHMRSVRQRLQMATQSATEDKKLGNRTSSALDYLLKYKQMAHILEAVTDLEVTTRLSQNCCKRMVSGNAVGVLIRLIRSCNRSLPHMEVVKYTVSILLNLCKYEGTVGAVFSTEGCLDTLIELMQIFREKPVIFIKTCTLLGLMCIDTNRKQVVRSNSKVVEKLRSFYALTQRKHKITENRRTVQNKVAASRSFLSSSMSVSFIACQKLPQIQPDWVLRRDSTHELSDSMTAIKYVMTVLHLPPK